MSAHLKDVKENYLEHMVYAQKYGFKMIIAGLACIIHSLIPDIFVCTASNTMKSILEEVEGRKQKNSGDIN